MSRSFKKPVSNARFIWHSICCINHGAMPKWRAAGHRWHRRYNKRLLRLYEKTFDENYLDKEIVYLKKHYYGDIWMSPSDGSHKWYFKDYFGYMK